MSAAVLPSIAEVHERYLALDALARQHFSGQLGGKLLFRPVLDAQGIASLIASNVAGAASLAIDSDPELVKQILRAGLCDFVVNDLDEALRILKNEIRKQQPVSVCLISDISATVAEMSGRGVQPDIVDTLNIEFSHTFLQQGAQVLRPLLQPRLSRYVCWKALAEPAKWLPLVDRLAAESLQAAHPETKARLRWLEAAPRYTGRALRSQHCVAMDLAEVTRFLAAVEGIPIKVEMLSPGSISSPPPSSLSK